MLRHKAYIQGARLAFGFSGIYDEDEKDRIEAGKAIDVQIVGLKSQEKQIAPVQEPEKPIEGAFQETEEPVQEKEEKPVAPGEEKKDKPAGNDPAKFVPSDSNTASPETLRKEIATMVEIMNPEKADQENALEVLSGFTSAGKVIKGVRSVNDAKFTDAWVKATHRKVKDAYTKWAEVEANWEKPRE
jgi:hypothetical protein